jgi:mono/diheme cytochrome c family protein
MTKTNLFLVCLGLGLSLAACAPPDGPAAPSFETDVKPIMLANCVRCHGQGDKLNVDPGLAGTELAGKSPLAAYLDHYEDRMNCGTGTCIGAASAAAAFLRTGNYFTRSDKDRMPPKPSDPLSDREIGIIQRWAAEMPTPKP